MTTLALVLMDPMSVLQDSADEMSRSLSSKVQERSLKDRRVSVSGGLEELSRERQLAMLRQLLAKQGGQSDADPGPELLELARRILKQPSFARQLVKEQGGDATTQYLCLLEVGELISGGQAGADPGGVAADMVREAAAQLLAEDSEFIRADINTFDVSAHVGDAQAAAAFRSAYRDVVLASDSLNATLQYLLRAMGEGAGTDFDKVLESTKAALGADLAAARPSADRVRLQHLVTDLYHLKVISTVVDQCTKLGQTLRTRHGMAPFKATELASDLVSLSNERWVDASRVGRLADRFGAARLPSAKVDFLTGARDSLRQLPPLVFSSPESRQSLLDAAQTAIDDAIGVEEGG